MLFITRRSHYHPSSPLSPAVSPITRRLPYPLPFPPSPAAKSPLNFPPTAPILKTMFWEWLKNLILDPEFNRKREFLKRVALFYGISRREFGTLFQFLVAREYRPGEILCAEGDVGRALFILEQGHVEVTRKGPHGEPQRLAILKTGDYFGEMSLIDEQPRTATVAAIDPVHAYLLYKTEIDKLLLQAPHIGAAIMTHLATLLAVRLRVAMSRTPFSLDSTDTAEPQKPIREVV